MFLPSEAQHSLVSLTINVQRELTKEPEKPFIAKKMPEKLFNLFRNSQAKPDLHFIVEYVLPWSNLVESRVTSLGNLSLFWAACCEIFGDLFAIFEKMEFF